MLQQPKRCDWPRNGSINRLNLTVLLFGTSFFYLVIVILFSLHFSPFLSADICRMTKTFRQSDIKKALSLFHSNQRVHDKKKKFPMYFPKILSNRSLSDGNSQIWNLYQNNSQKHCLIVCDNKLFLSLWT